jgi:hypothetical protein
MKTPSVLAVVDKCGLILLTVVLIISVSFEDWNFQKLLHVKGLIITFALIFDLQISLFHPTETATHTSAIRKAREAHVFREPVRN